MALNIPGCGCKAQNTCLQCEQFSSAAYKPFVGPEHGPSYVFCPLCRLAWPGWDGDAWRAHPHHAGRPLAYPGVHITLDILSEEEERQLMADIDALPWDPSQSGRRKQNFGPKANFNRRKLKLGAFRGFPEFGRRVQERLASEPVMADYQTIEQCSLEYRASEGACIAPHIDDCWVWGERVVTVSMLSDSVLTMVRYTGGQQRYNLTDEPACRYNLPPASNGPGVSNQPETGTAGVTDLREASTAEVTDPPAAGAAGVVDPLHWHQLDRPPTVRLPMPRRSLLVLYGPARYEWLHGILRSDISGRRVCLALREFTPAFLPGGAEERLGAEVIAQAQKFWAERPVAAETAA